MRANDRSISVNIKIFFALLIASIYFESSAKAQSQELYALTSSGALTVTKIDFSHPNQKLVKQLFPNNSNYGYWGLDYWNGFFYTFRADSTLNNPVSELVKFNTEVGDEKILGTVNTPVLDAFAISSNGTIYLMEQGVTTPHDLTIVTVNMSTLARGTSITVNPRFIGSDPGLWAVTDADFDNQDRLLVNTLWGIARFNGITSGNSAWEKDCNNSTTDAKPCWGGTFIALAADRNSNVVYGNTDHKIFTLNLPNNPAQVVVDPRSAWVGEFNYYHVWDSWAGMTLAPPYDDCVYYKIGITTVCL